MKKFLNKLISSILIAATLATQQGVASHQPQDAGDEFNRRVDEILGEMPRGKRKDKLDLNGLDAEIKRTREEIEALQKLLDIGTGKNDIDRKQREQEAPLQQFLENQNRLPTTKYLWLASGFLSGFIFLLLINNLIQR